jgi:hypothetical protein
VSKIQGDDGCVVAGAQEFDGGGVPEHVGRHALALERRTDRPRGGGILGHQVFDRVAAERAAATTGKEDVGGSALLFVEPVADGADGAGEGRAPFLASLAKAPHMGAAGEDDVADPQADDLGDAEPGVQGDHEECDDSNTTVETCAYGSMSCTVCGATCTEVAGLSPTWCGDGVVQPNEDCDDGDGSRLDGNGSDTDDCTTDCQDAACGDGVAAVDFNEDCDGADLGGESCTGLGFADGGALACAACLFNTSDCHECGDGTRQASERHARSGSRFSSPLRPSTATWSWGRTSQS